jgi:MFS family permease
MNIDLKKFDILYIIGLVAATLFMIFELIFEFVALNITFLIFFWTMKLLSGFGLILTVANVILWVLNRFTEKFSKKDVQVLIIIQVIVPGIFVGYAIYSIISSLPPAIPPTGIQYWFDLLLFLYGIISLMLSLYIIPLIREEFQDAVDKGIIKRMKRGTKKIGRKMKKGYFSWRGKYAKVQIQDQMTLGEVLDIWRNQFAVYLLIPIAIGTLIFTPITFICIVFWLKIIVFDKGKPKFYERIALLISMIWITTIACLSYTFKLVFFTSIEPFFWTIQVFYLVGIVISAGIFINQFIKLKGITIKKIKEEIRERRAAKDIE